ncbi:MAG: tRNA lysidine(34) synthetase TilS [Tissierellia bacterium]|nr:tRNA lysidine(34) synthetase TilS [Tissierellia bacterium]
MKIKINNKFLENIKYHQLINEKDKVIAAISGGSDSVFLFYQLLALKEKIKFDFLVCHLNHLHRKEAYEDENFVKSLCDKYNIKCIIKHKSMDQFAKDNKLSPEDAGRVLRYKFFRDVKAKYSYDKIAIAHNMNDQAETVLMRLIRGTGIDGLSAMDFKDRDLIRPILNIKKNEIESFLISRGLEFKLDKTNLSTDYTRNKIRIETIKMLESINPKCIDNIFRLTQLLHEDLSLIKKIEESTFYDISKIKDNKIYLDRKKFDVLDTALKNRVIRLAILNINGDLKNVSKLNIDFIRQLEKLKIGKKINFKKFSVIKNYNNYEFYRNDKCDKKIENTYLRNYDDLNFSSFNIKTSIINQDEFMQLKEKNNRFFFDIEKITFPLLIRTRENGDRIKPIGMGGNSKKVKDLLIDLKVDKNIRNKLPIILSNNHILAIIPLKRSNLYKIRKETKEILMIEYKEIK